MKFLIRHEKSENNPPKRLPLFACLIYLLIATVMFTGISFAKFATSESYRDNARVARFNVSTALLGSTTQELDLSYATGSVSNGWRFTVTNGSDVTAVDTVTVTLGSSLPNGVTMSMTEGGETVTPVNAGNSYTYTRDMDFSETHNWYLCFTGNPDDAAGGDLNVNISVEVEQKD